MVEGNNNIRPPLALGPLEIELAAHHDSHIQRRSSIDHLPTPLMMLLLTLWDDKNAKWPKLGRPLLPLPLAHHRYHSWNLSFRRPFRNGESAWIGRRRDRPLESAEEQSHWYVRVDASLLTSRCGLSVLYLQLP